jgi:hypothetical protein
MYYWRIVERTFNFVSVYSHSDSRLRQVECVCMIETQSTLFFLKDNKIEILRQYFNYLLFLFINFLKV